MAAAASQATEQGKAPRAAWTCFDPQTPGWHPTLRCDRAIFNENNFKALVDEALGKLPAAELQLVRCQLGYLVLQLVDAHDVPTTGVLNATAFLAALRESPDVKLHLNHYPESKYHSSRRWRYLVGDKEHRKQWQSLSSGETLRFAEDEKHDWEVSGDAMGREALRDIIADPPPGNIQYGIGAFSISDARAVKVSIDSGWDTEDDSELPGITSPYVYISKRRGTGSAMHVEDADLVSANEALWGSPKIWLIISPESRSRFEEFCKTTFELKGACMGSQWIRHEHILFSQQMLKDAGIPSKVVAQLPGQIVLTFPGAYHQVINKGPNIAVAVNVGLDLTDLPGQPRYKYCSPACDHIKDKRGKLKGDACIFTEQDLENLNKSRSVAGLGTYVDWDLSWNKTHNDGDMFKQVVAHWGGVGKVRQLLKALEIGDAATSVAEDTGEQESDDKSLPSITAFANKLGRVSRRGPPTQQTDNGTSAKYTAPAGNTPTGAPTKNWPTGTPTGNVPTKKRPNDHGSDGIRKKKAKSDHRPPRNPPALPPPLHYHTAVKDMTRLVHAYSAWRQKSSSPSPPGPSSADALAMGQATPEAVAEALCRSDEEKCLQDFRHRILKMHLLILYEKHVGRELLGPGVGPRAAPRGSPARFARSLALDDSIRRKLQMDQWLKDGRKYYSLSGRSWEGRWILAVRGGRQWAKEMDVAEWMDTWEDSARMARLKGVAQEFVAAVEGQAEFGLGRLAGM